MAYKKKIPMRKCLGCEESKPKKELLRIVRSPEGVVSVDLKGKSSGRGCYICPSLSCYEKVVKNKLLEKALEIEIGEEVLNFLKENVIISE